jgi:hypothetical protein
VPVSVRAGVLDGIRPLPILSYGSRRGRGQAQLRIVQRKEKGKVVVDHLTWCLVWGLRGLGGPQLLGLGQLGH